MDNQTFHLRRRMDDLVYVFDEMAEGQWKRRDASLWIRWEEGLGWVARDPETGAVAGQSAAAACPVKPPEGRWMGASGAHTHVYDLIWGEP